MANQIALIVLTSLLTALITIAAAWFFYQRWAKVALLQWFDARVEELGEQLQDRVREGIRLGVEDNTEELGDQLQERVREGIRLGIEDSIENLGADVVTKTTRSAVETGLGVFEEGVSALFGVSSRKKRAGKNDDDSGG